MRSSPLSGPSTNTVSEKPRSAATLCRLSSGTSLPSRKTPRGLPPAPPSPTNTRSTCSVANGGYPLVDLLLLSGPLLVAQDELLDLAGRGLREVCELDGGGGLEAGDALLAVVYDLLLGSLLSLLEGDEGLRALAPLLIGDGDDRGLHHRRMPGDRLLHLDGRDVLAAGDDYVLAPVADLDVPVRVPHGHVPRVVPAALERLFGSLLVLEVALGYHVAVHHDLAHRLAVLLYVVHVLVHYAYQVGGDVTLALASHDAGALLVVQLLPLRMDPARGHRAVGLRETVNVERADVELGELAEQGGGGRGAGYCRGDVGLELVRRLAVDYADLDRRSRAVVRDPLRLEELPDTGRLDLPQTHVGPGDGRHCPRKGPAVAVEHRERPQVLGLVAHTHLDDVP